MSSLREIAEAATPGPWTIQHVDDSYGGFDAVVGGDGHVIEVDPADPAENARFIATFDPPTVLALLDVVEAFAKLPEVPSYAELRPVREALARLPEEDERD